MLLQAALTDETEDRAVFMHSIDASYRYEGYTSIKQKMYKIRRMADVFKEVTTAARKNQMQRPAGRVIRFPKTGS